MVGRFNRGARVTAPCQCPTLNTPNSTHLLRCGSTCNSTQAPHTLCTCSDVEAPCQGPTLD